MNQTLTTALALVVALGAGVGITFRVERTGRSLRPLSAAQDQLMPRCRS